jgi:CMP-N-acetylneuraminic acid synthetase/quercetin dioxygenase-like cupin family protein
MKIIAMIPARLGSKRVPRKNLRLIFGKPLIAYIIEAAKASGVFDEIYLNSEAEIFREIAEEYGINFYKRDNKFATDETINDDFANDFIEKIDSDICVQLLPTSPLITGAEIRRFVREMKQGEYDTYVSLVRHQIASIYEGKPVNFSVNDKHKSSQEMKPVFSYGTVCMGWKTDVFKRNIKEIGAAYHGGVGKTGYFEITGLSTIDIDEEDDFHLAEVALRAMRDDISHSEPTYYQTKKDEIREVDVPTILRRDGVLVSDFEHENMPVTDVESLLADADNSVSWCRRIVNTDSNSATIISQLPNEGNRLHYHPDWNEWWYILHGKWKWEINGEERIISKGQIVFIPKGTWHRITAIGDEAAVRLAVSRADVDHVYGTEKRQKDYKN